MVADTNHHHADFSWNFDYLRAKQRLITIYLRPFLAKRIKNSSENSFDNHFYFRPINNFQPEDEPEVN